MVYGIQFIFKGNTHYAQDLDKTKIDVAEVEVEAVWGYRPDHKPLYCTLASVASRSRYGWAVLQIAYKSFINKLRL